MKYLRPNIARCATWLGATCFISNLACEAEISDTNVHALDVNHKNIVGLDISVNYSFLVHEINGE